MPHTRSATISDAQIGRAFRQALAFTRGWDIVRLDGDDDPYGMVAQRDGATPSPVSADEVELSAPSLELLIQALLEEELETGRALAIDELFDDDEHGFNLNGITQAEYEHACDTQFAPAFSAVPGLLSKFWLSDPATNTYGGVYTWSSREAMQQYSQSSLFQAVVSHPNLANITSRDFSILEQPTRVTRGMM